MGSAQDPTHSRFSPQLDKSFKSALAHRVHREFPRIGGPRIRELCAEMILEVVEEHLRPREHVQHGQVVWLAVSVKDPPARQKRIRDTDLIPVLLDLSTPEDIEAWLAREPAPERHLKRALRLCQQAYEQGAVLSNIDLCVLTGVQYSTLGKLLSAHEERTGRLVPRRATLHDVGTGVTHKRIICRKRYLEGKESEQVARETYHSIEAVDRYLGQFDRVRHCRREGMTPHRTAYMLSCSLALVRQYLRIDDEIESQRSRSDGHDQGAEA